MAVVLFFGDSIAFGAWDEAGGWVERIHKQVNKKVIDSNFLYYEHIYNLGICGDTTTSLLNRLEEEIVPRIRDEEDTQYVVVFAIGINDSQINKTTGKSKVLLDTFKNNLAQLLQKSKKYSSKIIFISPTPVDEAMIQAEPSEPDQSYTNESIKKFHKILQEFCEEQHLLFIDVFNIWIGKDYKELLIDGLHPNTKGHEEMYQMIFTALQENKIL